MKKILNYLISHQSLNEEQAKEILLKLMQQEYNSSQIAAFMMVYSMRGITVEELKGFRTAMLEQCVRLDLSEFDIIDLCGTGGDGQNTFNISTLASFIVAGAGQKVAKHGNNGVSSLCGSSNLLLALGYQFTNDENQLKRELDEGGITFLHAPLFHPAMKTVAHIRKDLGIRTFFNMLGPIVNPAQPNKQLIGVFDLELMRKYAYLHQNLSMDYTILHTLDGYDEISLTSQFKYSTKTAERIVQPQELGFDNIQANEITGGETVEESKSIFLDILNNKGTAAQTNVSIANAALALMVGNSYTYAQAVAMAKESLESGKAMQILTNILKINSRI